MNAAAPLRPALFNPLTIGFRRDPYPVLESMISAGFVRHRHVAGSAVSVFARAAAEEVLTDWRQYSSQWPGGTDDTMMICSDPPRHTEMRRMLTPYVGARALQGLGPVATEVARCLAEPLLGAERVDLVEDFARPLVCTALLRSWELPADAAPRLAAWVRKVAEVDGLDCRLLGIYPGGHENTEREIRDYIDGACRSGPPGLQALVERAGPTLARALVREMLFAGNQATTNLIANAIQLHAGRQDELRLDGRHAAEAAIEVALAARPPVSVTYRRPTSPHELGGCPVRSDDMVLVWLGVGGRDQWGAGVVSHLSFGARACLLDL